MSRIYTRSIINWDLSGKCILGRVFRVDTVCRVGANGIRPYIFRKLNIALLAVGAVYANTAGVNRNQAVKTASTGAKSACTDLKFIESTQADLDSVAAISNRRGLTEPYCGICSKQGRLPIAPTTLDKMHLFLTGHYQF